MIFNKSNNGQQELKALLGFLYASNNFDNIKTDITLAEEDMIPYIGQGVYDMAEAHYQSEHYGTGGEYALKDKLVQHIQLPVALYAWNQFSQHLDVTHSENGRKVILDKNNESMAWEWMLNRDDDATLNKAHKTTDRLIAFLEKNAADITEWKDSAAQKTARSLFINTAQQFDEVFPIDRSRRFFIKIIPFIREVEIKDILPVLGKDYFDELKAKILSGDPVDEQKKFISLVKIPLAYLTLSIAVRRLSFTLLPNGIFQDYDSEFQPQKARKPAADSFRNSIAELLQANGLRELENLQKELAKKNTPLTETYVPSNPNAANDPTNKYFAL